MFETFHNKVLVISKKIGINPEEVWDTCLIYSLIQSSLLKKKKRDTCHRNALKTSASFQALRVLPSCAYLKIFLLQSQEMWNLLAVLMCGFTRKRKMQQLVFLWQWGFSSDFFPSFATSEPRLWIPHSIRQLAEPPRTVQLLWQKSLLDLRYFFLLC